MIKRFLALSLALVLLLCAGCVPSNSSESNTQVEIIQIDPSLVDAITENWVALEMAFQSTKTYNTSKVEQFFVDMDVVFTHRESGETLTIPSFWDGDNLFAVRFAPTQAGLWDYKTICETDESLDGIVGTIGSNTYLGELDVYKHGFVKTDGKKYFVYDDGKPFFYIGDTNKFA